MKKRFEVLDVFRGIFAFLVVYYHLSFQNQCILLQNQFVKNSFLFVDFFFVLSGFVIAYNYESVIAGGKSLGMFIRKRVLRLFPLHLFLLLLFLCYVLVRNTVSIPLSATASALHTPQSFLFSLFFLNSIQFPGMTDLAWNFPSWSISAEMIAYLAFALMMFGLRRNKPWSLLIYFLIIALAVWGLFILNGDLYLFVSARNGFLRGLVGFFTGCICFRIYTSGKLRLSFIQSSVFEVLCLLVAIGIVSYHPLLRNFGWIYELVFLATVLVFSSEAGIVSKSILHSRFFQQLGKISYSVYLNHMLILIVMDIAVRKVVGTNQFVLTVLVGLTSVFVFQLSTWTYRYIEKPFMNGIPLIQLQKLILPCKRAFRSLSKTAPKPAGTSGMVALPDRKNLFE